ncbi:RP140-upstream [Clonorchis sinensis]|nr:RP140-upstream [Clonorchis sinensis]
MGRGRRQMLVAGLVAAVPGLIYGSVNCVAARQLGLTFEDMYREHVTVMTRNQFVEP